MRRECKIKVKKDKDSGIVKMDIQGDMAEPAVRDMEAALEEVYELNPSNILVKFDSRTRINSTGIAMLINLVIDSREKECHVYLTGMSQHFRKIFDLVGLTKYATIVESEDDVVSAKAS